MDLINNDQVPIGFSMALAKDMNALTAFSNMDKEEKKSVVNHSRSIQSKREMQQYVSSLADSTHSSFL